MIYKRKRISKLLFKKARPATSIALSLLMIIQAFGPGLIAVKEAIALSPSVLFSESFGAVNNDNVGNGWVEIEGNASFARKDVNSPLVGANARLTENASISHSVNVSGYKNIQLTFKWRGDSGDKVESTDRLIVYWKKATDASYTQLGEYHIKNVTVWSPEVTFALPTELSDDSVVIKFDGKTYSSKSGARVDNVQVTGTKRESEEKKINICHATGSEENPWEAIKINENAWNEHEDHGDFPYEGEDAEEKETRDAWCEENAPRDPEPEPTQCVPGEELIKNGSFENPEVTHGALWDNFDNGTSNLDWAVEWMNAEGPFGGDNQPELASLELHRNVNGWLSFDGLQHTELDGDWEGPDGDTSGEPASTKIYQDIPTVPGREYEIKFAFSPRPGENDTQNILGVTWEGTDVNGSPFSLNSTDSQTEWTEYSKTVVANDSLSRIQFEDRGTGNSVGTFLDNVSVKCKEEKEECDPIDGLVVSNNDTKLDNPGDTPDTFAVVLSPTHLAWDADVDGSSDSAKWIWSENPVLPADTLVDTTKTFIKNFNIPGTPIGGTLNIAADNFYTVWVNGTQVGAELVDENNFQIGTQDSYDVSSLLVSGSNEIKIEATNKGVDGSSPESNPAGLMFALSWNGKDCGEPPPPPPEERNTVVVHIAKYLDGEHATSESANDYDFPMQSSWNWPEVKVGDVVYPGNNGSGFYGLNATGFNGDPYEANTAVMNAPADYSTNEITDDGRVIPIGGECSPGEYRLLGYRVGGSFADAKANDLLTQSPNFENLEQDRYIIVENETCPDLPSLELSKSATFATSTGKITFTIDWKVSDDDVDNLVITDNLPTGTTYVVDSATDGGVHDGLLPGTVTWNLGSKSAGASGALSFEVTLDAALSMNEWASGTSDNNQGKRKDGTNVLPERSDPNYILGVAQTNGSASDVVVPNSFFALGFDNGNIVVTFDNPVWNGGGNDIKVYETTGGTYPTESVKVEAWDGSNWVDLGIVDRDGEVDLGSLSTSDKIRLSESSNKSLFETTADGYDVDAVRVLHKVPNICDVKNTANASASYGEDGEISASSSVTLGISSGACEPEEPNDPGDGEPDPEIAGVTVCKYDDEISEENLLSGWTIMLRGEEVQNDLSVDSSLVAGADSVALLSGTSYLANAIGTWTNQGGNNPADAEYSTVDNWVSPLEVYPGFSQSDDVLDLRIQGQFSFWGGYKGDHSYWQSFIPLSDGPVNFGIFDGENNVQNPSWFADNSGSLLVDIYEGYSGVTGDNGCVTFEDVPFGDYVLDEIMQDGWENISGLGEVSIDESIETFDVVNSNDDDSSEEEIIVTNVDTSDDDSPSPSSRRSSGSSGNNGGGGGSSGSSGGSGGGAGGISPLGEVLGATSELPGLPNAGNGPINFADNKKSFSTFMALISLTLSIMGLNLVSASVSKKRKTN